MLESVRELGSFKVVLFRAEPYKPIFIDIDLQGVHTSDHNIESKIVFVIINKMWFTHILLHYTLLLLEIFLFGKDKYTAAS